MVKRMLKDYRFPTPKSKPKNILSIVRGIGYFDDTYYLLWCNGTGPDLDYWSPIYTMQTGWSPTSFIMDFDQKEYRRLYQGKLKPGEWCPLNNKKRAIK